MNSFHLSSNPAKGSSDIRLPSPRLLLASSSPRRRELIGLLGLPFEVSPSRYEEPSPPTIPVDLAGFVTELATNKAWEVAQRSLVAMEEGAIIVAADTLVSLSDDGIGVPLGKPMDRNDARRMLRDLSGRTHRVYTGITLLFDTHVYKASYTPGSYTTAQSHDTYGANSKGTGHLAKVTSAPFTRVTFRQMTDKMVEDYIATGEPMDKAGAYGAQGFAAPYIQRIEGDYFNVVGLSLCELAQMLERIGARRND